MTSTKATIKQLVMRTPPFRVVQRLKDLVLEKLDRLDQRTAEHSALLGSMSANDTSILEGLVHLVQRAPSDNALAEARQAALLREMRQRSEAQEQRFLELERHLVESNGRLLNRLGELGDQYKSLRSSMASAGQVLELIAASRERLVQRPEGADEPELGLVSHLASFLPRRVAIDVGAHVGLYSEALLGAGFEVHAFEPNPKVLDQLRARLGTRRGFFAHGVALGGEERTLALHLLQDTTPEHVYDPSTLSTLTRHALPDGLSYSGSIDVPVRTLEGLHADGTLPAKVGYLKVDTEGFDLQVLRGMGDHAYPMVSVEFWDPAMEFGKSGAMNSLPDLVSELQGRGYQWWIAIYRVWGDTTCSVRFFCNASASVDRSWGNAFFFQDHSLFAQAERWCAAVLPRTYFAPTLKRNGTQLSATRN